LSCHLFWSIELCNDNINNFVVMSSHNNSQTFAMTKTI
jgi:hypothetical protein